ncbi:MAG TPA: hypothetical protein VLS89_05175 [Candidatus Nanopelagicales bacterium]|nr:hypothetical protein [Candidatus Nanopelagicales bacterium]
MTKRAWGMIAAVAGCFGVAGVAVAGEQQQARGWGMESVSPAQAVDAAGKRFFELTDADENKRIDRQEAQGTATFLVKTLFLAADQDESGKLEANELDTLRRSLHQHPLFSAVLEQAALGGRGDFAPLARTFDLERDPPITQEQLLASTNRAIDGIFARADADGNNLLTPQEIHQGIEMALLNQQSFLPAFMSADANRDGVLSHDEATKLLLVAPSDTNFRAADADQSGTLSPKEARTLLRYQLERFGVEGAASPGLQQQQRQQQQR